VEVTSNGFHLFGIGHGILKQLFSRSLFFTFRKDLVSLDDVEKDKEISLRSVGAQQLVGIGQGFVK
jgi:hypothetical protein